MAKTGKLAYDVITDAEKCAYDEDKKIKSSFPLTDTHMSGLPLIAVNEWFDIAEN